MRKLFGAVFGRTESALLAAILVTAIVFSVSSPYFLTFSNFVNLIEAYSVTTILAAGVFVVLVSAGIDVSFTATAAATQYVAAYLVAQLAYPAAPALALATILGVALGCINALLTYYLRVVSIIVTIATSSIYYALLIYLTKCGGDLQPARLVVRPRHVPAFRHSLRHREDYSASPPGS
jgi:simple sugar transport system permease protein